MTTGSLLWVTTYLQFGLPIVLTNLSGAIQVNERRLDGLEWAVENDTVRPWYLRQQVDTTYKYSIEYAAEVSNRAYYDAVRKSREYTDEVVDITEQAQKDRLQALDNSILRALGLLEDSTEAQFNDIRDTFAPRLYVDGQINASNYYTDERIKGQLQYIHDNYIPREHWWDTLVRFFANPWLFILEWFLEWLTGNVETVFDTVETALWGET